MYHNHYEYCHSLGKVVYNQLLTTVDADWFDYKTVQEAIEFFQEIQENYSVLRTDCHPNCFIDGTKSKVVKYLKIILQFKTEDDYGYELKYYQVIGVRDLDDSELAAYNAEIARKQAENQKRDLEAYEALKRKLGK